MKKIIFLLAVVLYALTPQEYLKIGTQEAIYDAANEYYKQGNYEKSIELYKKINKPSLKFNTFYNLANAYAKTHQFQKAIEFYNKALQIKKDKDAIYNKKLIEKLLKKNKTSTQNQQKNKKKNQKNKNSENKNKKQKQKEQNKQKNKNNSKKQQNNQQQKKQTKENKNTQKEKSKTSKNTSKPTFHKEKLKKFKIIKESNTTDIRKRYFMNRLKELKFNTLLLPLRSE